MQDYRNVKSFIYKDMNTNLTVYQITAQRKFDSFDNYFQDAAFGCGERSDFIYNINTTSEGEVNGDWIF